MKKKLKYIIPIVMVFGLCAYIFSRPKNIVIKYDLPIATSYHDLIEKSDIVVKGRFIGFNHEWNMARDKDNNPSDVFETIGKVDNFEITDIYKGTVKEKSIIEVNQRYSERIYYTNNDRMFDTSEINADTPRITALDQLYIEPDLTKEYILFLNYEKDYNNYYGSTQPFMVSVKGNELKVESNLINTNGVIEKKYNDNSKNIIVRSEYGSINDFSNDVNLKQFANMFN